MLPSGPTVIPLGNPPGVGTANGVNVRPSVYRQIWLLPASVIQRLPSRPATMLRRSVPEAGTRISVITPAGVIRPIWFVFFSVNQRLPSGPAVMSYGMLFLVGTGQCSTAP